MATTNELTVLTDAEVKKLQRAKFDIFTNGFANPKISKSNKSGKGVFTIILMLAPAKNSGYQVCPFASPGCAKACLYKAGRGAMSTVERCRIDRTTQWFEERELFKARIVADVFRLIAVCKKYDLAPAVRMNGTSDIRWESVRPELFDLFPNVQFYDYTKDHQRLRFNHYIPDNYHLTFSRSEDNDEVCLQLLESARSNVAVVFHGDKLPETWNGYPVYNADKDDLRFLDLQRWGAVAGLFAKGPARYDSSGFCVGTPRPLPKRRKAKPAAPAAAALVTLQV